MKKRFLFILALGAVVALSSSCAKKCVCIYYEDDKKIQWSANPDVKYYTKDLCDNNKDLNWKEKEVTSKINPNSTVSAEQKCKLK